MYQLPLRFIKLSPEVAVCATRIVAMMDTESFQARETLKTERKNGTLINACGRKTAETAVFLDNGTVIASPLTVNRILGAIERSNAKQLNSIKANETRRLKVYEAVDENPDPAKDQDFLDVSCDIADEQTCEDE
jgi:regulator of extracellular matrix RemA (YlzA/DUF370 family)